MLSKSLKKPVWALSALGTLSLLGGATLSALVVPNEIQLPGTQPTEVGVLSPSLDCEGCHANTPVESDIWHNWQGSMMSHASRDPLFWAAMAVAEQDFDGSGDLCLRCHTPLGWLDGRSTPTDGSGLFFDDFDGVSCHLCHTMTDPDQTEHLGVQNAPFVANDGGNPAKAYLGSGMYVIWPGIERLGPYAQVNAPHGTMQSSFHRSAELCGTCHDVSNPLTGDLAPNNGAALPLQPGTFSGVLGSPVDQKAAFNNFPHAYGVVERTFSEHQSSPLAQLPVSDFLTLPVELRAGSLAEAYRAAVRSTHDGNYADGTLRTFSCQSCHMPPVEGPGCAIPGSPVRDDLPLHDLTGGNYWAPEAIVHLDTQGKLVGGGFLSPQQTAAMSAGSQRAKNNLRESAALRVEGDVVKVFNLTGHKLITGYPEGRRMWLRTRWYDAGATLLREDGAYGSLAVTLNGSPMTVESLLDLDGPETHVWQAKPGVSAEWAQKLLTLGLAPTRALTFDRMTGDVVDTVGDLAAASAGTWLETMHFSLNNVITSDNRIPPYGMDYDAARVRNALPMPENQFGDPGPGGVYEHWDEVTLNPPAGASSARVELLYQPTSWEYIQFLVLANDGSVPFLGTVGDDLLEAWTSTGMAAPVVMAEAHWGAGSPATYCTAKVNSLGCTPAIGSSGLPSASLGNGFQITASNLRNRKLGILFYGTSGAAAAPFKGGTLCMQGPLVRARRQNSGGATTPTNDCSGGFSYDFNEYVAGGSDPALVGGQTVWAQYWSRDQGSSFGVSLTDALQFTLEP
jgi:hypothetical protein